VMDGSEADGTQAHAQTVASAGCPTNH
jgi:hypothetical protein